MARRRHRASSNARSSVDLRPRLLIVLLGLTMLGGCVGSLGDSYDSSSSSVPPRGPTGQIENFPAETASPVIRLLSRRELGNAIEALVGFRPASLDTLPVDKTDLVYDRV